jgi:hypothetical protein
MIMTTRRGKPRDPLKEQFWRRTIADQAQCGLPVQAYCRRKGLDPRSFRSWRQELDRRDAEVASDRAGERPAQSAELERPSAFLPVRVVRDAPVPTAVSSPIEIVPGTGPTVRVLPGFDPYALDAVLSVLEARRC